MSTPQCKSCNWEYTVIVGNANGKPHFFCLKCGSHFTESEDSTTDNVLFRDTAYDDIWNSEDKETLVSALHDIVICEKCNYGSELEKLTFSEKAIYVCAQLKNSVRNGGFSSLIYNYSDILICDVINALVAIGADKTADIYKKLLAVCGEIPKELDARNEWIVEISDDVSEAICKRDDDFFKEPDDLTELSYQYIMKNRDQFFF